MTIKRCRVIAVFALAIFVLPMLLSSCGGSGGENEEAKVTVLKNGVIYTVAGEDWEKNAAEALAFDADGKILAVGSADDVASYEDGAEVVDLEGQTVFPGFMDTHAHIPGNAVTDLYEIDLSEMQTKEDSLAVIKEFIEGHPEADAYYGNGFSMGINPDSPNGPRKEWLDEICSDKAIVISSLDVHSSWLNTKAFELMGITTETKLENGSIPVDPETGELWGVVTDGWDLITMGAVYTSEEYDAAMEKFQTDMLGWGFTGMMGVAPYSIDLSDIKNYVTTDKWKMRLNLSGSADPTKKIAAVIEETDKMKEDFASDLITVSSIKFFADGVVEGMTAYLSEPYAPGAGKGDDFVSHNNYKLDNLKQFYVDAIEAGYQLHTHSIGDQATTDVLDAMEYAYAKTGATDNRDVITHLQVVKDSDKKRMAKLGVIGSTQPFWHLKEPEWYEPVDEKVLGSDRAEKEYPVKSLIDVGIKVTFSSDHPVSPINNPFWAVEVAVTRNLENAEYYGVDDIKDMDDPKYLLNKKERISLKEAIEAYTINGAYQLFREGEVGSLEEGKLADFIIVSQDPFKVDPIQIDGTSVVKSYIGGKLAYEKPAEEEA